VLDILALKMLLQLAMQDIGQLTDIELRLRSRATPRPWLLSFRAGGDSAPTAWSV
jgi:hypothetical protein